MFNVRNVLLVVVLWLIVSGSVFLEGMEKLKSNVEKNKKREVKEVYLTLKISDCMPCYPDIKEKSSVFSYGCSIKSLSKQYDYIVRKNALIFTFIVNPIKDIRIMLYGKEANKDRGSNCTNFNTLYLPEYMLLNNNGTFKGYGDRIKKIRLKQESFDILPILEKSCFDYESNLRKMFYCLIKSFEKEPIYCIDSEKELLDESILVKDSDGKIKNGSNGFDFSRFKIFNLILILTKIRNF